MGSDERFSLPVPTFPPMIETIVEVAIPLRIENTFHYLVPSHLVSAVEPGKRVFVPFGRRKLTGYVVAIGGAGTGELREIIEVLDAEPLVTAAELDFLKWMAGYYHHSFGEVIKTALPAGLNIESKVRRRVSDEGGIVCEDSVAGGSAKVRTESVYKALAASPLAIRGKGAEIYRYLAESGEVPALRLREKFGNISSQLKRLKELGLVECSEREVYRDPFKDEDFGKDVPLQLNPAQRRAFDAIVTGAGRFSPFLLHGVTGSGKTEVYLQSIAHFLAIGKKALVLVPEISLTPQLVKRFKRRFDCGIAVLHSGLSEGERFDEWRRIRRGEVSVVIGARSAIFAPLAGVGIIVVDEEHEDSYKQGDRFRYHARDMALMRGKREEAVVVLGSATPLITSFAAVREAKLGYLPLPERVRELSLPTVEVVDARPSKGETLSPPLVEALRQTLQSGKQALLFLNRRGFATFLLCKDCGHVLRCPNCSVTLTYHRGRERHFCHYCDFSVPAPTVCPGCGGGEIALFGLGTERVEAAVKELFPAARTVRMDRDTTGSKGSHAKILREVEDGRVDILIGTQMVAKGHDFPGVTLVGVISADASLNLPDFRAAERTFQLLTQVIGRAGRGDHPGRVIIQTFAPEHYAVRHAASHDFPSFYEEEIRYRQEVGYPPFSYLAALHFSGNAPSEVEKGATAAGDLLRSLRRQLMVRVEVLGPSAAPLAKIRGRYRWQVLLKGEKRHDLHRLVSACRHNISLPSVVRMAVDMDPVDML